MVLCLNCVPPMTKLFSTHRSETISLLLLMQPKPWVPNHEYIMPGYGSNFFLQLFILNLLLCIFHWCITGNHCKFCKFRVKSSLDQSDADWFPVKQKFFHFSSHYSGKSASVLVVCLDRIMNGMSRGQCLFPESIYPA